MQNTTSRFLNLNALAGMQNMRFSTRHRIEGTYSGRHTSRTMGGSGEFADYRQYTPGEDLRRLDWRVMARTGRAYVKLFQDETNLICTPVIDLSNSMRFGAESATNLTGSKLDYVQHFVCALTHIVCFGRDQMGLATISDCVNDFHPPGSTPDHVSQLYSTIDNLKPAGAVAWQSAMGELFRRSAGRGVMLLISDFLSDDLESLFSSVRLFRHRGWEVITMHLVHPDEQRLPAATAIRFEGMEGEGTTICSPHEIQDIYQTNFKNHLTMVRSMALSAGCDYRMVTTAIPYLETLSSFLVERSG